MLLEADNRRLLFPVIRDFSHTLFSIRTSEVCRAVIPLARGLDANLAWLLIVAAIIWRHIALNLKAERRAILEVDWVDEPEDALIVLSIINNTEVNVSIADFALAWFS